MSGNGETRVSVPLSSVSQERAHSERLRLFCYSSLQSAWIGSSKRGKMFLVTRRSDTAGCRERSSSMNAAVTLESLPEESGRNCCLSMLHGRETNLPCLSDITQIRCSFQETFRKLLRASLTSCAPGGPRYRFFVSRGTFFLFYLTRSKHSEASNRRKAETLGMRPLRGTTDARQRAFDRAGSTVLRKERPPKPVRVASQTSRKYSESSQQRARIATVADCGSFFATA